MKRSEPISKIAKMLFDWSQKEDSVSFDEIAPEILDYLEKEAGMLPPVGTCKLIPDTSPRGGFKHSETKREWDEE